MSELLRADLSTCPVDEVVDSSALIAYCWVDFGLKVRMLVFNGPFARFATFLEQACEDALTQLLELYFKALDAGISRLSIIVIASDVGDALVWLRNTDRKPVPVFVAPHGGDTDRALRYVQLKCM